MKTILIVDYFVIKKFNILFYTRNDFFMVLVIILGKPKKKQQKVE